MPKTDKPLKKHNGQAFLLWSLWTLSPKYVAVEQLFNKMKHTGLVKSLRGPGGGYVLAIPANEINIAQIIDAVEDSMDASVCQGHGDCLNGGECLAHRLWQNLSVVTHQYLSSISLADVDMLPDATVAFQAAFQYKS